MQNLDHLEQNLDVDSIMIYTTFAVDLRLLTATCVGPREAAAVDVITRKIRGLDISEFGLWR